MDSDVQRLIHFGTEEKAPCTSLVPGHFTLINPSHDETKMTIKGVIYALFIYSTRPQSKVIPFVFCLQWRA